MAKIPLSVLVVIHTLDLQVLLIRRADAREEFWQSVTGSKDSAQESWRETALREVREETGIDGAAPGCCAVGGWRWKIPVGRRFTGWLPGPGCLPNRYGSTAMASIRR